MMRRSCRSFITALALVAAACGSQRLTVLRAREPAEDTAQIDSLTVENAARLVATTRDRKLVLSGLTTLSADVATALAAFDQTALQLGGLKQISPETAQALATSRATSLDLGGLATPSTDVLAALANFAGMGIMLGLDELPPTTARTLATFKARRLRFTGSATLTVDAATALASFPGDQLWFEHAPVELTPEVARAIAAFKGPALGLDGVTTLSQDAARELAAFRGEALRLNGLTTLSSDAAAALATFKGRELGCHTLKLRFAKIGRDGPPTLEQARLVCICSSPGDRMTLYDLTALDGPDAEAIARLLATAKGRFEMPKLKRITPRALEALTAKGTIVLPPRESLDLVGE